MADDLTKRLRDALRESIRVKKRLESELTRIDEARREPIAVTGFVIACFGINAGCASRPLSRSIIIAWCVISFIFHVTCLVVSGIILKGDDLAARKSRDGSHSTPRALL